MASTVLIASLLTANKLKLCLTGQLLRLPTFLGLTVECHMVGSYGRDQFTWLATETSRQTASNGEINPRDFIRLKKVTIYVDLRLRYIERNLH